MKKLMERFKSKKFLVIAAIATVLIGGIAIVAIINEERNEPTEFEEQQQLQEKAKISLEEAKQIALAEVPGCVVYTSIDDEGLSKVVYEIYIKTDTNTQEVEVNAANGKIENIELADDFPQNSTGQGNQTTTNQGGQTSISQEDAEKIALDRVAGTVIQSEFDKEGSQSYYEVVIQTSKDVQEVKVDAKTGSIISVEIDYDKLSKAQKAEILQSLAKISKQEAEKIALAKVSGKAISIKLDEENNQPVYEVIIQTSHGNQEVTIDAVKGSVLEIDDM